MISGILEVYLSRYPDEQTGLAGLLDQIARGDSLNERKTLPGHVTGSAIVLSPDRTRILLIHHKLFDKWLQPGGHWDPEDASPRDAAVREAVEETGVHIAEQLAVAPGNLFIPLDIGAHPIPARPDRQEVGHMHYDFRYAFVAADEDLQAAQREVFAAEWVALQDSKTEHVQRSIHKLYELGFVVKRS